MKIKSSTSKTQQGQRLLSLKARIVAALTRQLGYCLNASLSEEIIEMPLTQRPFHTERPLQLAGDAVGVAEAGVVEVERVTDARVAVHLQARAALDGAPQAVQAQRQVLVVQDCRGVRTRLSLSMAWFSNQLGSPHNRLLCPPINYNSRTAFSIRDSNCALSVLFTRRYWGHLF
jgi:hypothetical protein